MWLKVCGNTQKKDVLLAQELGFDAVGFIFAPSPRQVNPEKLAEWIGDINITKIGVFVNEQEQEIKRIQKLCGLDVLQLHGDESPGFCAMFDVPVIKAIRAKDDKSLPIMHSFPKHIKILLDAFQKNMAGGTGKTIHQSILDSIDDFSRIILAGGIGPENIAALNERYHPFGFDVNSQVEISPGKKDHEKMKMIINQLGKKDE